MTEISNKSLAAIVRGLPPSISDEDFEEFLFDKLHDRWQQYLILRSIDGVSKGQAFIVAANERQLQQILGELNGTVFAGRALRVSRASSRRRGAEDAAAMRAA
jgi:RNA recognition motif-containing protein